MNELKQLMALINRPKPVSGKILSTDGVTMLVSTAKGTVQVRNVPGYATGDNVVLRNGELAGKTVAPASLPVYYV
jgi:hypothetical protein